MPLPTPLDKAKHSIFVPLVIRSFCTICHFWSSFPADYIPRIYVPTECELACGVNSVSKRKKKQAQDTTFRIPSLPTFRGFPPIPKKHLIRVIL